MKKMVVTFFVLLSLLTNLQAATFAAGEAPQTNPQATIEVRGTVIDEQNAYIPAAPITLDDGKGHRYSGASDDRGHYRFQVRPGIYTMTVEVEGFVKFAEQVDLSRPRRDPFDAKLTIALTEQVDVKDDRAMATAEPDKNLSAITLSDKDLDALPDDPDELLSTLKQMAGAAGGADDASVYVDGFRERGQIPPKEAILRISINQNPFAAEFQEPGNFRIQIITKPGADTFHGSLRLNFNDESLNARNAFYPNKPAYQMRNLAFNFTGPIIHNRWGFFVDFDRRAVDNNSLVNATVLDPVTFLAVPFVESVLAPTRQTEFSIRTDYLATKKHTFGIQYRYNDTESTNQGVVGFNLPERAYDTSSHEDTLRLSLTTIASEHAVNEFRTQLSRRTTNSMALNLTPAVNVLDTFVSGGNQGSLFIDNQNNNLDLTDNLTYTWKTHTFKAGFRAEGLRFENINRSNFGGTFTFGSENGSPLDLYRRVVLGAPNAHPSQFTITRGDPFIGFSQWQMGSFIQDDWKVKPTLTLSFGLRHEFQNHLQDKLNFAPRFGLAWQPDKAHKSTIRAGAGIFFTGLDSGITSDTIRLDGVHQQQFTIIDPNFFIGDIPSTFTGAQAHQPTIRIKSEGLNDPYSILATVSYERQLPWKMTGSVGYRFTRGIHLLRSRNINAPLDNVLPFPGEGPILQYESTGLSERNEINVNVRTGFSQTLTFFGGYTLSRTKSNTDGSGTMPSNPYDLSIEWGRAANDSHNNVFLGGSYLAKWSIRISPIAIITSGRPFNITTGRDLNNDLSYADRPSFAQPGDPLRDIVHTAFGDFNVNPLPGEQIIPRNFGQGPGMVLVNLNIAKTFGFGPAPGARNNQQAQNGRGGNNRGGGARGGGGFGGPRGGGGGFGGGPGGFFGNDTRHKYNLTLGVNMTNVLNHTNLAGFSGTLTSPFFGIANQSQNGRRIEAQLRFAF